MYYCSLCGKGFDTRKGLQYLYASGRDDDDVVRYWDWVVCKDNCADRVRAESAKIMEDREF